jgi:hypothetical protein
MARISLLLTLVFITLQSEAQMTFYASGYDVVGKTSKSVLSSVAKRQVFNISLKDKLLIHTVFKEDEDEVEDSQIYQITTFEQVIEGLYVFTAKSGVSGNSYDYRINLTDSDNPTFEQVVKDEEYNMLYKGTMTLLKTFEQ